jgi:hypothetical protein
VSISARMSTALSIPSLRMFTALPIT